MTPDNIRTLTNRFCQVFKKMGGKPSDLKGVTVVLIRGDGYWDLVARRSEDVKRRDYVTAIEVPEDLCEKPLDEALIDLAGVISSKLSASARTINANINRDPALKSEIARKAGKNRWKGVDNEDKESYT